MPLGNITRFFNSSPSISLGLHQSINRKWRMDSRLVIVPFINNESLDFTFEGKSESTRSLTSINIQLGLTREYKLSKKYFLGIGISLGLNILSTDIESLKKDTEDHTIATLDIGTNLAMRRLFKNGKSISVQSSIHYSSFNWIDNLNSDLGSGYVSIGLIYGF